MTASAAGPSMTLRAAASIYSAAMRPRLRRVIANAIASGPG